MAVITEVESEDDELPPLVGSGSQATTASHVASPPKQDKAPAFSKEAAKAPAEDQEEEEDEDDDDELPPLISSAPQRKVDPPQKEAAPEPEAQPPKPTPAKPPAKPEEALPKPQPTASPAPARGPSGLGSGVTSTPAKPQPAQAKETCPAPTSAAEDRIVSKDDLDDALDVLEDGHYEEAELLAGEVRRQAAEEGNAEREADALRVVTKAQIKDAEQKGFEGLPDIEVLEQALKATNGEIFTFEKQGEMVAKAIMQLASAEIYLAMDSHAQALPVAQQALSAMQQAAAPKARLGMAYRSLVDIYFAQGRYSLVARMTKETKAQIGPQPATMAEARELVAVLLTCAKARSAAMEGAQAVQPAKEACQLSERMGDPKRAALAACEEAKAHHSIKSQAARKAALNAVALAKEACDSKTEAMAWHCACLANAAAGMKLEAVKAGRQALALAREVRDVELIGSALQALMQCNGPGEEEKSSSLAEEELMMAKKIGDRRREAYGQQKMAQAMIMQDRPREAIRRATDAQEKLRQMGDLKGEAKATQLLVELQCQARNSMEATRAAKDAQRLFKEAGDTKNCVVVLQLLTSFHLEAGDPHGAVQAARDQVKVYREAGFKEEEASSTLGLADLTQQTMGPRDALRLCKDAASMFRSVGDPAGEARALTQAAQMHLGLKANSNAMQSAKQAEELAREAGDEKVLIAALQAVGEAYASADRFSEGVDAAKEAMRMVEKAPVKEDAARAAALASLANVQLQVAHYDVNNPGARLRPRGLAEALKAAEEALALHRQLGDRSAELSGIQRIFHAHLLGQDGPNSLRYAREYMDMAQSTEGKENLGGALVSLCQAHFLCRNWDEAERANVEARAIFEKVRSHENIELCDQIMRELKQEMERDRRPNQLMGRANATQGGGQGYNSLLPERQRAQQGVPSGGFGGVPAGGFGRSESTQQAPAAQASQARSERPTDTGAKGFSDGLRGAFSKSAGEPAAPAAPSKPSSPGYGAYGAASGAGPGSRSNASQSSTSAGNRAGGAGGAGVGGFGASRASQESSYGSGSSRYASSRTDGGSSYGGSGSAYGNTRQGVAPGGFGRSGAGVPAGGFGGGGVPAGGRPGVQAGGFGGASGAGAADSKPRPQRSAFAGFAGARGLGRGEE